MLLPDSNVIEEKFAGLAKSMLTYKSGSAVNWQVTYSPISRDSAFSTRHGRVGELEPSVRSTAAGDLCCRPIAVVGVNAVGAPIGDHEAQFSVARQR
ncbi:MAG: hypothetical protein JWN34_4527 [Bryobacterales bacterium]|nr:hypothetical protein [Bryobacterales bacterium]